MEVLVVLAVVQVEEVLAGDLEKQVVDAALAVEQEELVAVIVAARVARLLLPQLLASLLLLEGVLL